VETGVSLSVAKAVVHYNEMVAVQATSRLYKNKSVKLQVRYKDIGLHSIPISQDFD
jgi:hypothetical protein